MADALSLSRLLVARTDKLGDFMLTWPALALARVALPEAQLDVLVSPAVTEIAQACPYVDDVIVDAGGPYQQLRHRFREGGYDAGVALFGTARVAKALWGAFIPYRLGPATKLHQFLFNHRLKQRRSQSAKPEYEYNCDLIRQLLLDYTVEVPEPLPTAPFWVIPSNDLGQISSQMRATYAIADEARLVIIHPGSGGSARNLATKQFAELANRIESDRPVFVLVTAGPGEEEQASTLAQSITTHRTAVHVSKQGLVAFAHVIALADTFISGSTGPLHIAGNLDVPTLAFYPRRRSATALRWQTTNRVENRLAFSPPDTADELDMQAIDINAAAKAASQQFLSRVKSHE